VPARPLAEPPPASLVGDDPEAPIIDAIIVMAHALGMTVVAEGVETTDQIAYLRARGCDEAQGFHFSRGVAVSEVVPTVQAIGGPLLSRLRARSQSERP
jgi:EAL domain-containing protein (putative c-di-GMP-specific phosphodiesterase class I)